MRPLVDLELLEDRLDTVSRPPSTGGQGILTLLEF